MTQAKGETDSMEQKKRAVGRPRVHAPGEKPTRRTRAVTFSLTEAERETLAKICADLDLSQSDFLRRAMGNWWIFKLTDPQLDALRSLGQGGNR